ncbi:MAG: glycosyltransferase family 2 protein [Syntrophaceae bacterium]|nr:glycosyltransferase family 2 protein [Syntrophaceae bacterium]
MDPQLSVIIPNWNGKRFLQECLDSLKDQTYSHFETILVDNGSTDGSADFVRQRYGGFVRIIQNEINLGFAGGTNVGIRNAKGDYIVLLNNDTWADPLWLQELVKAIDVDSEVGMWGSKIYSYYQRDQIEAVGELIYWDGLCRAKGQFEQDQGQYDQMEEIFFPPGCGAMYRKKVFDEIGLFDEDFFAYADDAEIGIRARLAGWKGLFVPKAILYHKNSGTGGQHSPFKAFYVERNRFWITIKYFPFPLLLFTPLFTILRFLFQAYGALSHRGAAGKFTQIYSPWHLIGILFKAYGSGLRGLHKMWEKRRRLSGLRKVSFGEIFGWFIRFGISAKEISLRN